MRSECKGLHRSSTLDAHVLPVAVRKAGDEVKTEPRRRKAMRNIGPDLDQEAKARGQAQLDQRHLEAYRNMHRLRDALCRRYAALLTGKVRSQRARLQRSDEAATAKAQKETKQKQKKLAFTKLQHNDSYLKALPKTSYYLIFDLQKQLAERGHLRSHHDLEDFYRCIRYNCPPSQLHNSLEDVRIRMLESRPAADLMTQHKTSEKHPCTAEDRREEVLSRWRQPTQLLQQGSGPEEIFGGSQMKDENEQMFPKIIPETLETSGKAEIYLRRLRRMHDLCLTNMAFSKRLLDKETDSLSWQEERGNRDLPPRQQVTPNKVTRRQYSFVSVTLRCFPSLTPHNGRRVKPTSRLSALRNGQEESVMRGPHIPRSPAQLPLPDTRFLRLWVGTQQCAAVKHLILYPLKMCVNKSM
ncbi:uncharacterized protein si:ch211-130h14.4 isoform X3 [Pseudoliparis swirei]|uniref:uncharacterized protein si:ch211-130h14.4 isoform X3 n=1 Tax=Pseudoliparis swirei TaxID=2059687 RepID=UPI0024BE6224|nr:uncharacterized protein si:ch211-130h14.4 isoform X3 [Pseudoliparis swirei]XP_056291727.1 uncharacterized protein si:ch211-130h14.4 isoform X3 [Pseudoliparis swirei]